MCNHKHPTSVVPEVTEGEAFKLFSPGLTTWMHGSRYFVSEDGWVRWLYKGEGGGFCLLKNESDAIEAPRDDQSPSTIYRKVQYRRAFATHREKSMDNQEIILVEEFKMPTE